MTELSSRIRQGLPRVPGGQPWPPLGSDLDLAPVPRMTSTPLSAATPEPAVTVYPAPLDTVPVSAAAPQAPPVPVPSASVSHLSTGPSVPVRRGLPREPDGEPWPPAGSVAALPITQTTPESLTRGLPAPVIAAPIPTPVTAIALHGTASIQPPVPDLAPDPEPAPVLASPSGITAPARNRPGRRWTFGILGAIAAAGILVLAARGVTTLPGVPEFLERYPGEVHHAVPVENGFPAWARWSHFLNFFFMVLIVRSGLIVRRQQKPSAFYTPKRGGPKVSLFLWMHLSLDVLWLANGVFFVVLLFATGHWVRIVPTSWEVFPNALSAMLQYLTLEWPAENGWVAYNGIQQLMYFTVVFIAAPLAAISGVRMSAWWPTGADRLNRLYPAPIARAIHFPVMLFFVLFVIVHVFLVFSTGALGNLNHMFAGQDTVSWAGFWWFAAGLVACVATVLAARPLVLAPIAGISGRVSAR